jgi:hypothetical protein
VASVQWDLEAVTDPGGPVRGRDHQRSLDHLFLAELAYTVIGGIPVRNYRADITLEPAPGGTRIRWAASWDRTLAGRLVHRSLRRVYPQIVADLTAAAEKAAEPGAGSVDPGSSGADTPAV